MSNGVAPKRTREIADRAAESGMLPHDLLLAIVRGEVVGGVTPTFADRLDAAKAAAPYFAPKLAAIDMHSEGTLTIHDVLGAANCSVSAMEGHPIAVRVNRIKGTGLTPSGEITNDDKILSL